MICVALLTSHDQSDGHLTPRHAPPPSNLVHLIIRGCFFSRAHTRGEYCQTGTVSNSWVQFLAATCTHIAVAPSTHVPTQFTTSTATRHSRPPRAVPYTALRASRSPRTPIRHSKTNDVHTLTLSVHSTHLIPRPPRRPNAPPTATPPVLPS